MAIGMLAMALVVNTTLKTGEVAVTEKSESDNSVEEITEIEVPNIKAEETGSETVPSEEIIAESIIEPTVETVSEIAEQPEIKVVQQKGIELPVPSVNTSFKAYMDYRCITDHSSPQWELQKRAYTDSDGLRKIKDDYCVAIGTYYSTNCGDRFKVELNYEQWITVIVADIKQDRHTNSTNQYTEICNGKGNMLEFIIDKDILPKKIARTGDVSGCGLQGSITKIIKIKE